MTSRSAPAWLSRSVRRPSRRDVSEAASARRISVSMSSMPRAPSSCRCSSGASSVAITWPALTRSPAATRILVINPAVRAAAGNSLPSRSSSTPDADTRTGIAPKTDHRTAPASRTRLVAKAIHVLGEVTRMIWSSCSGDDSRCSAVSRNIDDAGGDSAGAGGLFSPAAVSVAEPAVMAKSLSAWLSIAGKRRRGVQPEPDVIRWVGA